MTLSESAGASSRLAGCHHTLRQNSAGLEAQATRKGKVASGRSEPYASTSTSSSSRMKITA